MHLITRPSSPSAGRGADWVPVAVPADKPPPARGCHRRPRLAAEGTRGDREDVPGAAAQPGSSGTGPAGARPEPPGTVLSMTEDVPAVPSMPECNGSLVPEKGPLQVIGIIDDIARPIGTGPYMNADTSPDALLAKGNQEESRNSLVEDVVCAEFDGEKRCEGKVRCYLYLGIWREKPLFCV